MTIKYQGASTVFADIDKKIGVFQLKVFKRT